MLRGFILRWLITTWQLANISQRHFLLPCWLAEPAISSKITLSYRIIVEQDEGELKCFLQPGKGTKFRIELPLRHS